MSETQASEVVDDTHNHRFVVRDAGAEAELIYRARNGRLILVHTEVPPELSGHGVGGRLVEAALTRARGSGETIVPWCPFARRWLKDHPDRTEGLSVDWTEPPA